MANPNFNSTHGALATNRFDFQSHIDGTAFRHNANEIDVNPSIYSGITVEGSLTNIATAITSLIAAQAAVGQGFVTVGDGYDTWHIADGNTNFDPSVPSLDVLLNPVFNAIINNTTIPVGFERVHRGGIIIIKAGTYIVKKPIYVPAGISLVGEGYGTKIINASNLTLPNPPNTKPSVNVSNASNTTPIQITTSTPITGLNNGDYVNVSGVGGNTAANGTWIITFIDTTNFTLNNSIGNGTYTSSTGSVSTMAPVFRIVADANRSNSDTAVDPNLFIFSRETKIMNMVIADNFVERPYFLINNYKTPQNATSTSVLNPPPLVHQEAGSNLYLNGVYFLGRVSFSSGQVVSLITGSAVSLNNTIPAVNGSILKVNNCFIDGFAQPIGFNSTGGKNDYLEITDSKIRSYGYFNGDAATLKYNTIINSNIVNANITSNYLYGNYTNITSSLYINAVPGYGVPGSVQDKCRITLTDNDIVIDKLSGGLGGYQDIQMVISQNTFASYTVSQVFANNGQQDGITFNLDATSTNVFTMNNATVNINPTTTINLAPTDAGSAININPSGASAAILITPSGATSFTNISPSGASSLIHINPSGINAEIDINPSGTNAVLNINPTGSSANININPTGLSSITNIKPTGTFSALNIGPTGSSSTFALSSGSSISIAANSGNSNIILSGMLLGASGDSLRTGYVGVSLQGASTHTLSTSSESNRQTIKFTGSPAADCDVIFPTQAGFAKLIDNSTSTFFNLRLKVSGQATPVTMYPNQKFWVYCDGTNLVKGGAYLNTLTASNYTGATTTYPTTLNSTSSGTYTDSSVTASISGALTGDILLINGMITGVASATGSCQAVLNITDASSNDLGETLMIFPSQNGSSSPVATAVTLTGASPFVSFTVTAKIRFKSLGGTVSIDTPSSLVLQLLRQ